MKNNFISYSNDLILEQIEKYRKWQYKNISFLFASLIILLYFADTNFVQNFISKIGNWGYLGAFLTGVFFVSTFTIAPAILVLYNLAENLNPYEIAFFAGCGALTGDYIIFKFLKDRVFLELKPIFSKLGGNYLIRVFRTPYFAWLLPIIGAIIIASPLPDETGIGLLGLSKLKNWQFLLISFSLNAIGILIIVLLAQSK